MEGESTRQLKVAKELQRHLAEIIRSKGMASWDGALVSVSGVTISPDLAVAKVYVSIFPSAKQENLCQAGEGLQDDPGIGPFHARRAGPPDGQAAAHHTRADFLPG